MNKGYRFFHFLALKKGLLKALEYFINNGFA